MVALTFDDGPDPEWTPRVLAALEAADDAPATFFVVAEQIERDDGPTLIREILDRGHAIQMHCGSHRSHQDLSLDQLRKDAERVEEALAANGAPPPCLWRPPYGLVNEQFSCRVASERERQLVLWTHNTQDYSGVAAGAMLQSARDAPLYADAVILMHDSRRYAHHRDATQTVALIEPLVTHIRDVEWILGTLTARLAGREQRPGEELLLPCSGGGESASPRC